MPSKLPSKLPNRVIEVAAPQDLPQLLALPAPKLRSLKVSQSLVTTMEFCPRKALLSYGFNLRKVGRPSAADQGSYAHRVIQASVQPPSATGGSDYRLRGRISCESLLDSVERDQAEFYSAGSASLDVIPSELRARLKRDMEIGYVTGLQASALLRSYEASKLFTFEAAELPLGAVLHLQMIPGKRPVRIPCSGQADIIARDAKDGVWILDLKTLDAKKSGASWAATSSRRVQPWLYTNMLRAMHPEWNVHGFLVLLVKRPNIKLKKAQSLEDYIKEVSEWYVATGRHADKAEARKRDPAVQFLPLRVPFAAPTEIAKRLIAVIRQLRRPINTAEWPTRETCEAHYSLCPYAPICAGDEVPAVVVHRDYSTALDPTRPQYSDDESADQQ